MPHLVVTYAKVNDAWTAQSSLRPRLKDLINEAPPLDPTSQDPVAQHIAVIHGILNGTPYQWQSVQCVKGTVDEPVYEFTMRHRAAEEPISKTKVPVVVWKCRLCPEVYPDKEIMNLPMKETEHTCHCGGDLEVIDAPEQLS